MATKDEMVRVSVTAYVTIPRQQVGEFQALVNVRKQLHKIKTANLTTKTIKEIALRLCDNALSQLATTDTISF